MIPDVTKEEVVVARLRPRLPPPLMQIHMKELVCPGCSLRTLEAKGYIDARQLAQAIQFINFRVEKEGSPVYVPAQFLSKWFGSTFQHRKEFFVSGPKQTWQVTYKGRVTHIPGWPVYTQNKLAQNWL